jgi:hypothetical protein
LLPPNQIPAPKPNSGVVILNASVPCRVIDQPLMADLTVRHAAMEAQILRVTSWASISFLVNFRLHTMNRTPDRGHVLHDLVHLLSAGEFFVGTGDSDSP